MFGAVPRQALGAKVRTFRGAPERSRSRLGNRARRVAGADSRARPPGHWHVTAVEGIEPGLRPTPVDAVGAARPDRHRLGGDAFAAPLPIVRLGKMGRFIRVDRRFRRASRTEALVLSELAPERADCAILRPDRFVSHRLPIGKSAREDQYGAKLRIAWVTFWAELTTLMRGLPVRSRGDARAAAGEGAYPASQTLKP
jgi:hypothetical protein